MAEGGYAARFRPRTVAVLALLHMHCHSVCGTRVDAVHSCSGLLVWCWSGLTVFGGSQ